MEFKKPVIDIIKARRSIRSYKSDKVLAEDKNRITCYIKKEHNTVFGSGMRFEFIDASDLELGGKWEVRDGVQENKGYGIAPNIEYVISWDGS